MKPDSSTPPGVGRQSLSSAFRNAFIGIGDFLRERNSRIHVVAAFVAIAMAIALRLSGIEWAILIITISGVLAAEAINCAIERVVDLASPGRHELARQAKDLAAAAVLIVAIGAAIIGAILFVPHLIALARLWG